MTHKIFAKLNEVRQAISAALDIANLENEVNEAISELQTYDDNGDEVDSDELAVLYEIQDSIEQIETQLGYWETNLSDLAEWTAAESPTPTE